MTNIIEGAIQKIWKGQVKEHPTYGPSAAFTITVNGQGYKTFANLRKGDPFKEGDNVKFQFEEKFNDYTGNNEKYIIKGTLENLTNPQQRKGFVGGFKKDPEEQARIVNQSCLGYAIETLKHNFPETKILKSHVLELAAELVEFVYTNKPSALKQAQNPVKNDNNPPVESYQIQDDDVPTF